MLISGDVVRRPSFPWTPTIHRLLGHLSEQGLPVPEPLGTSGPFEFVRLLPGDAGEDAWKHCGDLDGVRSAGSLLRVVHDATADWVPPADAIWAFAPADDAGDLVICHGDPKPPNMTWANGAATGLFDWEAARPAPRIEDVAYAIQWIAPFYESAAERERRGFPPDNDPFERANAFLDGYGWSGPIDIAASVRARREQAIDEVESLGLRGWEPPATWLADGHVAQWRAALNGE